MGSQPLLLLPGRRRAPDGRRLALEQQTFSRVVEDTRAEMAGDLLESTDAAISEIARQLGYMNQANFTRAFRRRAGVSPSQFRRQRRPM